MLLVYAIPPLVASLTTLSLFFYVALLYRKSGKNLVIAVYFFLMFVVSAGEFFITLSGNNAKGAVTSYLFVATGSILSLWVFLYFSFIFPSRMGMKKKMAPSLYLGILLFVIVLMIFFDLFKVISNNFFQTGLALNPWGFYSIVAISNKIWSGAEIISRLVTAVLAFSSVIVLAWRYRHDAPASRQAVFYLLCGSLIMDVIGYTGELVLPSLGVHVFGLSSVGIIIMSVIIVYAIVLRRILRISPATEEKTIELDRPFEPGHYYVIIEDDIKNPKRSYEAFARHVKAGMQGLVITATDPAELRKKYGFERTPVIWITGQTANGHAGGLNVIVVSPEKLGGIVGELEEFLGANKNAIVIVDCLEYIIQENSGSAAQRTSLLELVKDFVSFVLNSDSIMLVPEEMSWLNVKSRDSVIKIKNLLRVSNFWPILLLETLLNQSIAGIGNEQREAMATALEKLRRSDRLFLSVKLNEEGIAVEYDYSGRFTYQDTVHYLKLFIRETGDITNANIATIFATMDRFRISRYEYEFESGKGYLLYPKSARESFEVFIDLVEHDYRGLYISRNHPKQYANLETDIQKRSVFRWVTDVGQGEETVPPRLEHIQKEVEDFIASNEDSQTVVVVENLPYLVKYTGSFDEVHLFVANLRDIVTVKGGVLIVPVDRNALSPSESSHLAQELLEVDHTGQEEDGSG